MRLEIKPKSATLNFLATGSEPLKLHPGPTSLPAQMQCGFHQMASTLAAAAAPRQHPGPGTV